MGLFSRKIRMLGKGTNKSASLQKELDPLNLVPVDYMYSSDYGRFLMQSENQFRKDIQK